MVAKKDMVTIVVKIPNETYLKIRKDADKEITSASKVMRDILISYYETRNTLEKMQKEG